MTGPLFRAVSDDEEDDANDGPQEREHLEADAPPHVAGDYNDETQEGGGEESDEDDLDPVVQRLPIYLTGRDKDGLYLFQYPLRPADNPYNQDRNESLSKAKVKKESGWVELNVPFKMGEHYDEERGQRWASGEGGPLIDHTLSGKLNKTLPKYMVGVVRNGAVHLSQVEGTAQLRPSLPHVDQESARVRKASTPENRPQQEARVVSVSAMRSGDSQGPQLSTTFHLRQKEDEPWLNLSVASEQESDAQVLNMVSSPETMDKTALAKCSATQYLDKLSQQNNEPPHLV